MNNLLVILCVFLFGLIAFLLFRLSVLAAIYNKESKVKPRQWNAWLLLLFPLAGTALICWYVPIAYKYFLPESASVHGAEIDRLFLWTLAATGFIFLLTQFLLFYFSFRYRALPGREAYYLKNNMKLEFFWTFVPFLCFVILFLAGQIVWFRLRVKLPEKPLVIEIMAEQFNWRLRYGGADGMLGAYNFKLIDSINTFGLDFHDSRNLDDFMPPQLHLPKGKPIELRIWSRDVIHSVYLPHFRVKMDAVPGMHTGFNFVAKYTTEEMREKLSKPDFNYEMACAELCGRMHFAMLKYVVVEEEDKFNAWYRSQKAWLSQHPEYLNQSGNKDGSKNKISPKVILPLSLK